MGYPLEQKGVFIRQIRGRLYVLSAVLYQIAQYGSQQGFHSANHYFIVRTSSRIEKGRVFPLGRQSMISLCTRFYWIADSPTALCRRDSYNTTPADTETLSDPIFPNIGIAALALLISII